MIKSIKRLKKLIYIKKLIYMDFFNLFQSNSHLLMDFWATGINFVMTIQIWTTHLHWKSQFDHGKRRNFALGNSIYERPLIPIFVSLINFTRSRGRLTLKDNLSFFKMFFWRDWRWIQGHETYLRKLLTPSRMCYTDSFEKVTIQNARHLMRTKGLIPS